MRSYIPRCAVRCAAFGWLFCVAAALHASSPARVFLLNGDQISGDVLSQTADVIILRTEAAGTLEIQRRAVKQVELLAASAAPAPAVQEPMMRAAVQPVASAALPKDPCRDGARPVLDSWMLQFQGTPDKVVLGTQSQVQVGGNLGLDFCEGSARDRTDLFAGGSHLRSYKKRSTAVITDTVGATLEQQRFFHKPGGAYVYGIGELFVNNSLGIAQEPSGGIGLGSPQFFAKGVGYNFSGDMRYVSEHLDHTAQSLNLAGLRLKQQAHLSGARFSWDEQIWVMPMLNDRHAFQAYALVGPTLTINSWLKLGLSEEEHYVDNAPKPNRRNYLASVLSLTVMRSGGGPK